MLNSATRRFLSIFAAPLALVAQSTPADQQPSSGFTLNIQSRLVIEDVSVIDSKGKPVTGLPSTAFHVFENGVPQAISEVHEQASKSQPVPGADKPGQVTNATFLGNQGTLVTLLIDPATMSLEDQMYLRLQAMRFVDQAPEGTQIAVFRCNSSGIPVLLQPPTTNKALLRTALTEAVPVMTRPVDSAFGNALAELSNIAAYLRPVPGKKAVLWLAGRFPLYEPANFELNGDDPEGREAAIREASRKLEQARIAVYPIDTRGVLQGGMAPIRVANTAAWANDPSTAPKPVTTESQKIGGQYDAMDQIANATGGRAFYSNNAVGAMMVSAVQLATDSYALSYRPRNYQADGKRHTVRITVDGPYSVHYRTSYFAEEPAGPQGAQPRQLLAETGASPTDAGSPIPLQTAAAPAESPLLFSAQVVSEGKQGKETVVRVRYVIPSGQLQFENGAGAGKARFRLAALAYNAWGDVLSQAMDVVETRYTPEQMKLASRIGTPADQTVKVAKGGQFLLLAVEDLKTERVGTAQVSLATVPLETAPAH